jgi:hypothetical protein
VLGNHDYGGELLGINYGGLGNEFDRGLTEVAYTQHSQKWKMPATHYTLRFGPVGLVMLDTNSIMWGNQDHGDQAEWIGGAFEELADASWVLAAGHHPLQSNGNHGNAGSYGLGDLDIPVPIDEINGDDVEDFMEEHVCGVADFYVMSDPSWNTFDRAEAESRIKASAGKASIKEVRKVPLLDVNEVMAEHFKDAPPAFLSIDVEGWEFRILKAVDLRRFRPKLICIETLPLGDNRHVQDIAPYMKSRGYVARGGSFVNTIFVDAKLL